jgi:plastocyanin
MNAFRARRPGWALCCLAACACAGAQAAPHLVVIDGMRFTPQVVKVKPGDTITWENHDMVAHNVTAKAARVASGDLAPGQSWRYTVRGGAFDYACTLHPMMTGRVELEGARSRDPPAKMK